MSLLWSALAVLAGYLLGSLSFAVIVSRAMGLADPRTYGSGNPGATNVLRSGSKAAAIVTLLLDALKGAAAVLLAQHLVPRWGGPAWLPALVGLAAFAGHIWPVFFRFKGGKGVATALGVVAALSPALAGITAVVFAAVLLVSRYASLASVVAALAAPFVQLMVWGADFATLPLLLMALLVVWRHFANIERLIAGTEPRVGRKAAPGQPATASSSPRKSRKGH